MQHTERRAVLAVALAASFLTPFMVSSVNIALPTIGRDLSMGAVALSWVTTAYLLCSAVLLIPFGKVADIHGRKFVFFWGVVITIVSSLLSAMTGNGVVLIATRMLHGAGAAMVFGTGMAILTASFPPEQRGKVLGFNVSFVYMGLMLGPVIGGFITRMMGWRMLFFMNIPIGVAILIIVKTMIRREWTEKEKTAFDGWGALLYGFTIAPVLVGFSRLSEWYGVALIAAGGVSGIFFIIVESKASSPIVPVSYFRRNRVFAFSNMAALLNYSATYAIVFLMSFYLQYIKGFTPDRAGLMMIVQPVMLVVLSPFTGKLSDRIEPRIPASLGMGLTVLGLVLLSLMDDHTPLMIIIVNMVVIGCGFALFSSPNMSAVMGSVEPDKYGLASATVGTMRLLGQVFSMGITMLFISIIVGSGKITPDRYPLFLVMMHRLTAIFSIICVAGVGFSLARGNVRERTVHSGSDEPETRIDRTNDS